MKFTLKLEEISVFNLKTRRGTCGKSKKSNPSNMTMWQILDVANFN
jgi:hypothetical protein